MFRMAEGRVQRFEVTVRVPLLGSRIEKRIIDEIQAGQPKVDALVKELLGGR